MNSRYFFAASATALVIVGCSGATITNGGSADAGVGSAVITGSIDGMSLIVQSATAFPYRTVSPISFLVLIANIKNECSANQGPDNVQFRNSRVLQLRIVSDLSRLPATVTVEAETLVSFYTTYSSTCDLAFAEQALSGSVVITRATSFEVDGTFDLLMSPSSDEDAGGGHITGSFSAPICPVTLTDAAVPFECL